MEEEMSSRTDPDDDVFDVASSTALDVVEKQNKIEEEMKEEVEAEMEETPRIMIVLGHFWRVTLSPSPSIPFSAWSFRSVFGFCCVSGIVVNTDNEQQL